MKPNRSDLFVDVQGPESGGLDERGNDEFPEWSVAVVDEDGDPVGKVFYFRSRSAAQDLGRRMARDRRLELNDESMPA